MSNILGIKGFNKSSGENIVIAGYGNDMVNLATGKGYSINLTSSNHIEFEVFLDSLFFQNFEDTPRTFDGSVWSYKHVENMPVAKYIKVFSDRVYIAYVKIGTDIFPSRVMSSDLPKNNTIQWGYEQGTNLTTIADNSLVTSLNSGFVSFALKRGDPFFITSGTNKGEYVIDEIIDDQHLTLTVAPKYSASNSSFSAGGNYFDVRRDDNDFITGLEENNNQLLIFKQDSLHRYDTTALRRIKGAFGTTSSQSIVNIKDATLYFHGSFGEQTGFYLYDGTASQKISSPVQRYIAGISPSMFTLIHAWSEGELYRAYLGNITNSNYNLSVEKAVFTYNVSTNSISIDPIRDVVTASTSFRQAGNENIYLGNSEGQILKTPDGFSFNNDPIKWVNETHPYFPLTPDKICTFRRVYIYSEGAGGVSVSYKLHYSPDNIDSQWVGLGEISGERTVLEIPSFHNSASGIQLMFSGTDTRENVAMIKRTAFVYKTEDVRI
jgi:hypothetical protein